MGLIIYIAEKWTFPKEITNLTNYKYILDIGNHFSKWYYRYLLYSKEAKEILKNLEIFFENFGTLKILQTVNGKEFKNETIKNFFLNQD